MCDIWYLDVRRRFECSWTGTTGKLFLTCTSFIRRKFRIYVNPNRRQNGFVWKVDTWISNKLRWIVSRNLECSFESFWCLQEKLYHWRRKFNWLRKHFKIEIQSVFLNLLIIVTKFLFSFKKLRWSIFHFLCNFLLSKINFSWKLSSSLYSVQGIVGNDVTSS